MAPEEPQKLTDRLLRCGALWAEANAASLGALGRQVLNDHRFFDRIDSPRGTTTATLEKFAGFLATSAQWPDGVVPQEVCSFAHAVGISSAACAASPDSAVRNIGADELPAETPFAALRVSGSVGS